MEWEMVRALIRLGFVFVDEPTQHLALRLVDMKEAGAKASAGSDEELNSFTAKWNEFCNAPANSQWKLVDEKGYKEGLWA